MVLAVKKRHSDPRRSRLSSRARVAAGYDRSLILSRPCNQFLITMGFVAICIRLYQFDAIEAVLTPSCCPPDPDHRAALARCSNDHGISAGREENGVTGATECEVLIVGGSLAVCGGGVLGHHGIAAQVVEKHAGTSIHPRAGYFHVGTMEAYRRIEARAGDPRGQPRAVRARRRHQPRIARRARAGAVRAQHQRRARSLQPVQAVLHNPTEPRAAAPRRAAEPRAELHYRSELVDFEQDEAGVTAHVRDLDTGGTQTIAPST